MQRVSPQQSWPLHDIRGTRAIEQAAASTLPEHALMQRASSAVARLARALAPHAAQAWVACGPGNNGGDGLGAAAHLCKAGLAVTVTWLGEEHSLSAESRESLQAARDAGVHFAPVPPAALSRFDLVIDALLGIGARPGLDEPTMRCLAWLHASPCMQLAIDSPTGLHAGTGAYEHASLAPAHLRHTLSLITLKPGLFTAHGRDAAPTVWLDTLGISSEVLASVPPVAWLQGAPRAAQTTQATHKGSFGDVSVLGGQGCVAAEASPAGFGMTGAAWLAGRAALYGGAGRVLVALLDAHAQFDTSQPELMLRAPHQLDFGSGVLVCGCGGGEAIRAWLPKVLATSTRLVLDADALNAIARDEKLVVQLSSRAARGWQTVLTPHPLEAARLLGCDSQTVQSDRLRAASMLADQTRCVVILKGSGSVIAHPGEDHTPHINSSGNHRLATAGTGDVLAGLVGALLAQGFSAWEAALQGCWLHGHAADTWPADRALTASRLAASLVR